MATRIPPQEPIVFPTNVASIVEERQALIDKLHQVHDDLVKNVTVETATFANVILPLVREENERYAREGVLEVYRGVSSDASLRKVSTETKKLLDAAEEEASTRSDVYALIDAVRRKNENLDTESQRLLDHLHREYVIGGANLQSPDRERFLEVKARIKELIEIFEKNQERSEQYVFYKGNELDGVADELVDGLRSGRVESPLRFGISNTQEAYYHVMRWAEKEETRKRQYLAFHARCPENVPVFKEIMALRDESARLVGYANHADMSTQINMAGSAKAVNSFVDETRAKLLPKARGEIEALRKMKREDREEDELDPTDKFYSWDRDYYDVILLNRKYPARERDMAQWFPMEFTLPAILRLFEHLFGISFEEIKDAREITWANGVKVYRVWDDEGEGGAFLGYMYLDPLPREGKENSTYYRRIQPGYIREDGTRHYSSAAVLYTINPHPVRGLSSQLQHHQVEMLAHEIGHAVHDFVSRTQFARFHGSSGSMDFCEGPGQLMEYFCWDQTVLQSLSMHYAYLSEGALGHYTAGVDGGRRLPVKRFPPGFLNLLVKRDEARSTLSWLDRLVSAGFDQRVHQPGRRERVVGTDFDRLFEELERESWPGIDWEGDRPGEKNHRGSNYEQVLKEYGDGQQYHYIFSEVFAADIWQSRFKNNPLDPKEGRRLRYEVLEKGWAVDEMELVTRYLGRQISSKAFFERLGINTT